MRARTSGDRSLVASHDNFVLASAKPEIIITANLTNPFQCASRYRTPRSTLHDKVFLALKGPMRCFADVTHCAVTLEPRVGPHHSLAAQFEKLWEVKWNQKGIGSAVRREGQQGTVAGKASEARGSGGKRGGFENTKLDDTSLSAHHVIYVLAFYCTTAPGNICK